MEKVEYLDGALAVALAWQDAANAQDRERVLTLSAEEIAIVGPRGTARGRAVLADWLTRAGASFGAHRAFARAGSVVLAQHGTWRDPATGAIVGEREVTSAFLVVDGLVARIARHDDLAAALADAGLAPADEVPLAATP